MLSDYATESDVCSSIICFDLSTWKHWPCNVRSFLPLAAAWRLLGRYPFGMRDQIRNKDQKSRKSSCFLLRDYFYIRRKGDSILWALLSIFPNFDCSHETHRWPASSRRRHALPVLLLRLDIASVRPGSVPRTHGICVCVYEWSPLSVSATHEPWCLVRAPDSLPGTWAFTDQSLEMGLAALSRAVWRMPLVRATVPHRERSQSSDTSCNASSWVN